MQLCQKSTLLSLNTKLISRDSEKNLFIEIFLKKIVFKFRFGGPSIPKKVKNSSLNLRSHYCTIGTYQFLHEYFHFNFNFKISKAFFY